jgi:hypothetical protein
MNAASRPGHERDGLDAVVKDAQRLSEQRYGVKDFVPTDILAARRTLLHRGCEPIGGRWRAGVPEIRITRETLECGFLELQVSRITDEILEADKILVERIHSGLSEFLCEAGYPS